MGSDEQLLGRLVTTSEELLRWQRVAALPTVRTTIEATLTKTEHRKAYELCDGKRTATEIGKAIGTTQQSVSNWTLRWRDLGIAYEEEGGRVHHLVSLAALGLPIEVE